MFSFKLSLNGIRHAPNRKRMLELVRGKRTPQAEETAWAKACVIREDGRF